jgi:ketosteroid isomerase-like protein
MAIQQMKLWRGVRSVLAALTLTAALAPGARADERARDVETLMADYTRLWSAKDAHAIWDHIYRLDPGQSFKSEADLAAEFARLTAQGYNHSDLQSVHGCLLTPKTALAVLRFSRLKADGTPLPPTNRASAYLLRRFDDGWRVTALLPFSASTRLDCASTTDP